MDQVNELQGQIIQIEAEIAKGCPIPDARARQAALIAQQQQIMCAVAAGTGTGRVPENTVIGDNTATHQDHKDSKSINAPQKLPHKTSSAITRSHSLTLSHNMDPVGAYAKEINAASAATGVPADLIGAVIYKESQANPALVCGQPTDQSPTGIALGLMQVEPNTSPEIQREHPEIISLNGAAYDIMLGSWRLADLAKQFDGWDRVLRAYNSGAWAPVLTDPSAPITTGDPKYVDLVNAWWERLSTGRVLPPNMDPNSS